MNNTPVLLHDHNEFLNARLFLKGIEIYANLIISLANVLWSCKSFALNLPSVSWADFEQRYHRQSNIRVAKRLWASVCRVLSLSDRRYSLNPLSQTRIDWVGRYRIRLTFKLSCVWHNPNWLSRTLSNTVDVQTELCLALMISIRRIVTYKIFINKQLKHISVINRLALFIY